jgi:ADP-heptose:LPS heptosyltransferase
VHLFDDLPPADAGVVRAKADLAFLRAIRDDGGDSGPIHLAHALGTPVLSVMGPTDPERHGPYGAPASALAHPLPCSYCYRRFTDTKACLLEIPAATVLERSIDILVSSTSA